MKKLTVFMTLFLAVSLIFSFAIERTELNRTEGKKLLVPDEIIVVYDSKDQEAGKAELVEKYQLTVKTESLKKGMFTVYKHPNPAAIMEELKREPGVKYVEQNAIAYAYFVPNDQYYAGYQWNLQRIGMEDAWDFSTGASTVVAIVDTGVRQTLSDFAGTNFMPGYDFVNNDTNPDDDQGHGTHVCGTVAQTTNNSIGMASVAFDTTIMPVKVLDSNGSGSYTWIANGIYYAVDNGADVINLSLGGPTNLQVLEDAVDYAWNNGVVVVCAAGNDSTSNPSYPAAYINSISVSATDQNDNLANFSNYGNTIDMSAPGVDIAQQTIGGYYYMSGTSQACPHVAGVAALVKSINPNFTNYDIRNILEGTAEDLGAPGWDTSYGHGLVDADAAVAEAMARTYMFLDGLWITSYSSGLYLYAFGYARVTDAGGDPVINSPVTASWCYNMMCYIPTIEYTDISGVAEFRCPPISLLGGSFPPSRELIFVFINVTHPTLTYDSSMNRVQTQTRIFY